MKNYWKMSNKELEKEAHDHNIEEYAYSNGPTISRERIISQLVAKDAAVEVPKASLRSWIALAVSVASLLISFMAR